AVLVDLLVPAAAAVAAVAFGALRTGGSSRFGLGSVSFRSVGFDGLGRGGLGSFGLGRISGFSFGRGSLFGSRLGGGGLGRLAGQRGQIGQGLLVFLGHYAPSLFLRCIDATSSVSGSSPACRSGCWRRSRRAARPPARRHRSDAISSRPRAASPTAWSSSAPSWAWTS